VSIPTIHPIRYWICRCIALDHRVQPVTNHYCADCETRQIHGRAPALIEIANLTRWTCA
jgi:hypothetical protein